MAELIVLVSGTGIPTLKRGSPGFLFVSNNTRVLIDSGSGTLRKILEAGAAYQDIHLLLYTHIHPDHVADLVPIIFAANYAESPRTGDLVCMGGLGFRNYFDNSRRTYGSWIEPKTYSLIIQETSESPLLYHDLKIISKSMSHTSGSTGYRIEFEDKQSIVFSGDTDYCRNIVDLADHTDLLVLECSFPDEKKVDGHLTPSLAGRIASESGCKKLLLSHFYPICDQYDILHQCQQTYSGETILAEDLMKITI